MKTWPLAGLLLLLTSSVSAADPYDEAIAAFERGDVSAAESILTPFLQLHPDNAAALGLYGAVLDAEKKLPEAEQAYRKALHIDPHSATLLNNYANHELASGDLKGARATYLKVLALDPGRANANLQLAAMAVEQKNGNEALRYLQHLQPADRNEASVEILEMQALFVAGHDKEGMAVLDHLKSAGSGDPRLNFTAGLALAKVGMFREAEALFSRALEGAPANFDVLYNLGLAADHAGDLDRARDVLQAALVQRPGDIDTMYSLANTEIQAKQGGAALALLAEAARIDPSRADVQLALAQTASSLEYYGDARVSYQRYLKLMPGDESAQREYRFMVAATDQPQQGLAALKEFVRSHPADATARYEIGLLEVKTDPSDASYQFEKALALNPDFAPARLGRGVSNLMQGAAAQALPDLQSAAKAYPDNASVLDRLGEAYLALNRPADAIETLRHASQLSPGNARILMHLSRAYAKAGQTEEARTTLNQFRVLGAGAGTAVQPAGVVDFLGLAPEQQQARYRAAVKQRMAEHPDDPDISTRYLRVLIEEGRIAELPSAAAHLLSLKPTPSRAADAGHALVSAGRFQSARSLLEYAVVAAPTPAVQLDLAIAVFRTAGPQDGLARMNQIPEAYWSADYYLALSDMLDAAGHSDQAYSALERAIASNPERADLYGRAASFLLSHGRTSDAVLLLDKAGRDFPNDPRILLLRAETLDSAQHAEEAEQLLKRIENRWPEWGPAYVTYASLLKKENRSGEAKKQSDIAIALGTEPGIATPK